MLRGRDDAEAGSLLISKEVTNLLFRLILLALNVSIILILDEIVSLLSFFGFSSARNLTETAGDIAPDFSRLCSFFNPSILIAGTAFYGIEASPSLRRGHRQQV